MFRRFVGAHCCDLSRKKARGWWLACFDVIGRLVLGRFTVIGRAEKGGVVDGVML